MTAPSPIASRHKHAYPLVARAPFRGSNSGWEQRYAAGGDSGAGSYGTQAQRKASVINAGVVSHGLESVVDPFASADRFVTPCGRDAARPGGPHERYRSFTPWISAHAPEWGLVQQASPPADVELVSDLFLFARRR